LPLAARADWESAIAPADHRSVPHAVTVDVWNIGVAKWGIVV